MNRETVLIESLVMLAETEKAILVRDTNGDQNWIPKSQIEHETFAGKGSVGEIEVAAWLAKNLGWL